MCQRQRVILDEPKNLLSAMGCHMEFYDFTTTYDLSRRAGLINDAPAALYR